MQLAPSLAFAVALLLSAAVHAQSPNDSVPAITQPSDAQAAQSIQAYCATEWPHDTLIQNRCIDQQNQGRAKAQQFAANPTADNVAIWARCNRNWTNQAGFLDWIMMSRCVNFEVEAYKK